RKVATFAIANVAAHAIAWIVVAPVLDILIYAEPAKKVFAQGAFAAVSNIITAVVVGGLLILAYTKTIAKKGSLDKE
ncbi:MAG: ECF transporter S component, partial [Gemmiger sp.]|nr:ECF transporter S component [Gemmiger sp.]